MTEADGENATEPFEMSASPESVPSTVENVSANVCRAAAISLQFASNRARLTEVADELAELGIRPSEQDWSQAPLRQSLPFEPFRRSDEAKTEAWYRLLESPTPQLANTVLLHQLLSPFARESVAAAAALWLQFRSFDSRDIRDLDTYWFYDFFEITGRYLLRRFRTVSDQEYGENQGFDPEEILRETELWEQSASRILSEIGDRRFVDHLSILLRWRLAIAMNSEDATVRALASAATRPNFYDAAKVPPAVRPAAPISGSPLIISTIVHGTTAWKGEWWRPTGDFHQYIRRNHRPNLYDRGARFSWSGAYSEGQREIAAADLIDWIEDVAPHGLQTLFAHSYGAEIAARAVNRGARIQELVTLSAPVNSHLTRAASTGLRIVDVRLKIDPVLVFAREGQRLTGPQVTPVVFRNWWPSHSSTHQPAAWDRENVATLGGLGVLAATSH